MAGTLDYIRMTPVCEVRLDSYWMMTDSFGAANFSNFSV